ncbi:MAG TPA: CdaR family protein [Herpetosiphonaceae bacterium]|nr:CdaR family protein [Herpetosiphonaceae bacterium]
MNRMRIQGAQFGLGLLLALTLWTYVSFTTNPNSTTSLVVPVKLIGPKPGLLLVDSTTGLPESFSASTQLSFSGPQQEINKLTTSNVTASANLEDAKPGVNHVSIDVTKPRFARIVGQSPSELTLTLARELVRTVPVTVNVQGQVPFSFSAGPLTQGGHEASVRGPEDLVRGVVAAVGQVNLQGQISDISTTVALTPIDSRRSPVAGVTLTPAQVSVQVPITAQVQVQQVSVVPDLPGQPAPGYAVGSIDWQPKTVQVFTSGVITGTIHTEKIDLTGLTGSITRTVGLERPANVITRPPGVRVTVHVAIIPIAVPSQLPLLVPVSPTGLGPGLTATAKPTAVQITLAGAFDRLNHFKSSEVTAMVDLTGLGPGTHTLPVRITPPDGLQVVTSASEPRVSVTITALPTPSPMRTPTIAPVPSITAAP